MRSLSRVLAFLTFILIFAGGLVTSTGSGLSVPDWPLSFGTLFPAMKGGVRFEHTHRLIAGTVAILALLLLIITLKQEKRKNVRFWTIIAFFAVILQAVLGGITVLYKLPLFVSVIHACLAQSFFAIIVCLSLVHSQTWENTFPTPIEEAPSLFRLSVMTSGFIFLQLILGAFVRHSHNRTVLVFHIIVAFLVLIHVVLLMLKINRVALGILILSRIAFVLGLACVFQFFLGLVSFVYKFVLEPLEHPRFSEVLFATSHQALGAFILASAVALSVLVLKTTQRNTLA